MSDIKVTVAQAQDFLQKYCGQCRKCDGLHEDGAIKCGSEMGNYRPLVEFLKNQGEDSSRWCCAGMHTTAWPLDLNESFYFARTITGTTYEPSNGKESMLVQLERELPQLTVGNNNTLVIDKYGKKHEGIEFNFKNSMTGEVMSSGVSEEIYRKFFSLIDPKLITKLYTETKTLRIRREAEWQSE